MSVKNKIVFDDDGFSEVRDANITRVDLVDKAANGTPFLLMKADGDRPGLFGASDVEALLKAGEPDMKTEAPVDDLAKADDDLDVTTVLADPDAGAPSGPSENDPGSPAWEAIDAATATKWLGIVARVKNAVCEMADREAVEAASGSGDNDDVDNMWNLEDATGALDYVSSVLAVYAASEATEVMLADEVEKNIAKALGGFRMDDLAILEGFTPITKAGRVLSTANENLLQSAFENIQKVLQSLPAAPEAESIEKEAATVAEKKSDGIDSDVVNAAVAKAAGTETEKTEIAKADAEDAAGLQAVYDANGKLVGVVDPANIQPVSGTEATPEAAPDPNAPAPAPAAPAAAPVAAAPVAKAAADADETEDVPLTKSAVEDLIEKRVSEVTAAQAETIDALEKKVAHLEAPAKSKVFTNGATGSVQTRDGQTLAGGDGATTAADLKKAAAEAPTIAEQNRINQERMGLATAMLSKSLQR